MKPDFCSIPPRKPGSADLALEIALSRQNNKIIVLDDDPTGTQTVHDIPVFTSYDEQSVKAGMQAEQNLFFLLTNSRSFSADKTAREHRKIAQNICSAARAARTGFLIISRGDSTLRGHWPLETATLKAELAKSGYAVDGEIICPFFPEGGRVTAGDIHYVKQGDDYIPAGETEFAKDATFGYRSSNLKDWIEEKTQGKIRAADVSSVSLEELRGNLDAVQNKLLNLNGGVMVVNAVEYSDLEVFVIALCGALGQGKRFLFRSAAALPRVLGGVSAKSFLQGEELRGDSSHGGLVIVGSHVARSTQQLNNLLELDGLCPIELDTDLALSPGLLAAEIRRASRAAEKAIFSGETVVLYTKRKLLDPIGMSPEEKLALSVRIANAVTETVRRISVRPSFIIAKGGITSSEIATNALGAKRAWVLGQAAAGIPVWKLGPESRYSGLPYIIFPGNVGEPDTLKNIVSGIMETQTIQK
ncbi:MAG: four-carbon acid sugar kinase family protein [Christensenella hongkongensis]|uniref:four-carbon acid sugar kinase family protein n=1 Tax=Christensenella hongkongensis TaxID=270498 RepID=UPI002670F3C2|nr:four-carbon acid sugar kinase family protein [Christensenella hongkongensis]MDY3004561.1 four-carbon acid sugar kinase family protein [Christensenella hongkongensis]